MKIITANSEGIQGHKYDSTHLINCETYKKKLIEFKIQNEWFGEKCSNKNETLSIQTLDPEFSAKKFHMFIIHKCIKMEQKPNNT